MSVHTVLIAVHATAATLALLAGVVALRSPRLIPAHACSVAAMTLTLIAAVITGRADESASTTVVFSLLSLLATVMTIQGFLAWQRRPTRDQRSTAPAAQAAIGFNCIGLVTGFVAVTTIHLTGNPLAAIGAPLATVAAGRTLLAKYQHPAPAGSDNPPAGQPVGPAR